MSIFVSFIIQFIPLNNKLTRYTTTKQEINPVVEYRSKLT